MALRHYPAFLSLTGTRFVTHQVVNEALGGDECIWCAGRAVLKEASLD